VDLEFFKQRAVLDFTVYQKDLSNLITSIKVPGSTGANNILTNVGSMTNKGVEIGLTLVPIKTKDFKWTLFSNFTKNRNEVTSLKEGLERVQVRANTVSYIIPGQPFGVFYGDKFARDANGSYLINPTGGGIIASAEPAIVGDPQADFKVSFINTVAYKGFSLKTQFDWKEGGDVFSTTVNSLLGRGVTKDTEDREHTNIIPGFYGNADGTPILDASGNQIPNTIQLSTNDLYFSPAGANNNTFGINTVDEASIFDGTVYRLREASLTYDLPAKFLDKTPFGKISFGIVGSNLWYFAPNVPKYTNFDPDTTSYGNSRVQGIEISGAPTSKRYGFRLNLTF
jgi:TonB dependent receptor